MAARELARAGKRDCRYEGQYGEVGLAHQRTRRRPPPSRQIPRPIAGRMCRPHSISRLDGSRRTARMGGLRTLPVSVSVPMVRVAISPWDAPKCADHRTPKDRELWMSVEPLVCVNAIVAADAPLPVFACSGFQSNSVKCSLSFRAAAKTI